MPSNATFQVAKTDSARIWRVDEQSQELILRCLTQQMKLDQNPNPLKILRGN